MIELPEQPGGVHPHVLVANCENAELAKDQLHHLEKVRRLRKGDFVSVTDGRGNWRWCSFTASAKLEPISDVVRESEPPLYTIGLSLTKGAKPDFAITKLVEIGIRRIIPFTSDRSIVKWDEEKTEKSQERFSRLVVEALQQSRQVWLPVVEATTSFAQLATQSGVVRADRFAPTYTGEQNFLLIGPEGGWSEAEQQLLPAVSLGSSVLRAETAAIVAGALMLARHQPGQ